MANAKAHFSYSSSSEDFIKKYPTANAVTVAAAAVNMSMFPNMPYVSTKVRVRCRSGVRD
jgi:hypothetical protein